MKHGTAWHASNHAHSHGQVNTKASHRAQGCPIPRDSLRVNRHQSSLWNGAAASGRLPRVVPRNVNADGCVDCGSCLYGCAYGSKRSTHVRMTWMWMMLKFLMLLHGSAGKGRGEGWSGFFRGTSRETHVFHGCCRDITGRLNA